MGYTTVSTSMFHPDMQQTPENVAKVIEIAGWNAEEAAEVLRVPSASLSGVIRGEGMLTDDLWKRLLHFAGRRAFDEGCDE